MQLAPLPMLRLAQRKLFTRKKMGVLIDNGEFGGGGAVTAYEVLPEGQKRYLRAIAEDDDVLDCLSDRLDRVASSFHRIEMKRQKDIQEALARRRQEELNRELRDFSLHYIGAKPQYFVGGR